jgi:ribosomal protein S18 acetylase RimI-like enzyme
MIRAATADDIPAIHAMIRELASYERALGQARATPGQLREALFGEHPAAFALIAEEAAQQAADGTGASPADGTGDHTADRSGASPTDRTVVGFALWFHNFSTWTGTHGIYLEDLYVRPEARGAGHGQALLAELARICVERGYQRFEWSVLDWNEPSIGFYTALGATAMEEWTVYRLSGEPLRALAASATPASPVSAGPLVPVPANDAISLSN